MGEDAFDMNHFTARRRRAWQLLELLTEHLCRNLIGFCQEASAFVSHARLGGS